MMLLSGLMYQYGCIDGKILKEAYEGKLVRLYDLEFLTSTMMVYTW